MVVRLPFVLPLHTQHELAVRAGHELDTGRPRRPPNRIEPALQLLTKTLEKSVTSVHTGSPVAGEAYFTSERFIHDDLAYKVEKMVILARGKYKRTGKFESYAIAWPSETITGDDGKAIAGSVLMRLQDDTPPQEVMQSLKKMVVRTKAYGLALFEKKVDALRILFETHHGARAWIVPLERHGDRLVPGKYTIRDNAECLGLLWQPRRGTA
jgi:hypothetical protein